MTDTQQPSNPARPAPLPQRQNGPQTVRIPVTNLVNPQLRRPISKGVPPEETPDEPSQEDEFDPSDSGDDQAQSPKASSAAPGEQIQLPRRPAFARAGERSEVPERSERSEIREPRPELSARPGQRKSVV